METKEHLKRKLAIDKAKRFAKENGCEFIDLIKIKTYNKVRFRCGCGIEHSRAVNNFYKYPKCTNCTRKLKEDKSLEGLLPLDIREFFKNNGTPLVDESNRPLMKPLEFYCKCGKIGSKQWFIFRKRPYCKDCGNKRGGFRPGDKHYFWVEDRERKAFQDKFRNDCVTTLNNMLYKLAKDRYLEYIGYSTTDLRNYFFNHPDYTDGCTIDHIFPISAFIEHNIFDFKLVNKLNNLRPLSGLENFKKYNKYSKKEFYKWLSENVSE